MALIFRESDRRTRRVHYSKHYTMPIEDETDYVDSIEYAATKLKLQDRLELLGYSLENSISEYNEQIQNAISQAVELGFLQDYALTHIENLKNEGFWGWVEIVKKVIKERLSRYDLDRQRDRSIDDIYTFILDYDNEDFFLGYPSAEYGLTLRAILEALDDADELVLNITSLVYAGYYEKDEEVCSLTASAQLSTSLPFQKILILTEGSSDTFILSKSLKLLYPHLQDYFSFMDFASARADGGTSALERTVKSFAAAGLNNKIIALFDNDTTGISALNALKKSKLPENIKLLALPNLEFARSYPTIGPQGVISVDINGRACSIELYLGQNIIKDFDGDFIPVKWSSLDSRQNDYQGEIIQKAQIQDRFKEVVARIEKDKTLMPSHSWDDIKIIFKMLFIEAATLK